MKLSPEEREKRLHKTRENKQRTAEMRRREFESKLMQPSLSDAERERMSLEIEHIEKDIAFIKIYFESRKALNKALYDLRFHEQITTEGMP